MELNEEERENWRKFEILKDLNIFGILAIFLVYGLIFYGDIVKSYGTNTFSLVITGDIILLVFGLLIGYICVDYLRPQIYGNRSFAFTFGVLGGYYAIVIYYIYIIIIGHLEGKTESMTT